MSADVQVRGSPRAEAILLRLAATASRTHVEDGRRPAELAPSELECLVHAKDLSSAGLRSAPEEKEWDCCRKKAHLGVVERGLVEVLQSLRDEEARGRSNASGHGNRKARDGRKTTDSGRTQRSIRRTMALFSAGVYRIYSSQNELRDSDEKADVQSRLASST